MFSVRIGNELKNAMDSHKDVNWSEIVRQAIDKKLENEKERNLAKAVLLNEKIRKKAPENFNSTEIIRKFRNERNSSRRE